MVVIKTRVAPPQLNAGLIERPRLLERMEERADARLTVVQAPAGYGKTTLLMQWRAALQRGGALSGWWSVAAAEHSARDVVSHCAAVIDTAAERKLVGAIAANASADAGVAVIANTLATFVDRPVFLFIDDLHLLDQNGQRVVQCLIETAPANVQFLIGARAYPRMNLARLRSQGAVSDIGAAQLQFTLSEAKSAFAASGLGALSAAAIARINEQAEGWAAGLRLAMLPMRDGADLESLAATFSGRWRSVSDYFAEVAFHEQGSDVREFLLETSVLSRLSPALCSAITGRKNSRDVIERVVRDGLCLEPLGDEGAWFRYHRLYRDFLQRRLADIDPVAHRELLLRASRWCVDQGLLTDAIDYAHQADDPVLLAELLEANCEQMTYDGYLSQVTRHAARLPEHVLAKCPRLVLALAWWRARNLDFGETRRLLEIARDRIGSIAATPDASDTELQFALKHREMMLAAAQDEPAQVEKYCLELIEKSDHAPPYLVSTVYAQLISARREQMHFEDFERLEARARSELMRSGLEFAAISLRSIFGQTLFAAGRADEAVAALEQGLSAAVRFGGSASSLAALPALPLAEIAYERNELDRANDLVESHLPVAREVAFVDQLVAGHLVRPRILFSRGDVDGAFASLDDARKLTQELGLDRFRMTIAAERVRLYLRSGQPALAARTAAAADILGSPESVAPHAHSISRDEVRATAWARVMISDDRTADAIAISKKWLAFCVQRNAMRAAIRWALMQAHGFAVSGDVHAAQRALRQGVMLAAPGRFIRSFLDEGAVITNLLTDCYGAGTSSTVGADGFAREILTILNPGREETNGVELEEGLYGRLLERELEILALVGKGLRNREIGARLGLTEGTVKWYMQQIYDKVGVRRRPQAVDRARQFGLIA